MLETNAPVWVFVPGQEIWQPAHFHRHDSPGIHVFIQGRSDHTGFGSTVYYDQWKTDETYRAERLGEIPGEQV